MLSIDYVISRPVGNVPSGLYARRRRISQEESLRGAAAELLGSRDLVVVRLFSSLVSLAPWHVPVSAEAYAAWRQHEPEADPECLKCGSKGWKGQQIE